MASNAPFAKFNADFLFLNFTVSVYIILKKDPNLSIITASFGLQSYDIN